MRVLLALLALLLLPACPLLGSNGGGDDDDDDSASGNDDDDSADDDDATGDDDDATGDNDEVPEDLPCEEEIVDIWTIDVPAGVELRARVDTVSADSTFDPALSLWDSADIDQATYLTGGDDEFDCTFMPPVGSCPEIAYIPGNALNLAISVENLGCANKDGAEYVITVAVDDVAVTPTLASDDYLVGGGR